MGYKELFNRLKNEPVLLAGVIVTVLTVVIVQVRGIGPETTSILNSIVIILTAFGAKAFVIPTRKLTPTELSRATERKGT